LGEKKASQVCKDERGEEGASQQGREETPAALQNAPGEPVENCFMLHREGNHLPVHCCYESTVICGIAPSLEFTSHFP
jgi:hypothetical protein